MCISGKCSDGERMIKIQEKTKIRHQENMNKANCLALASVFVFIFKDIISV